MTLQASDQRVPERVATIQAFVNVRRDNQPPFFVNQPYGRSIRENQIINTTILTVTATDNDLVVREEKTGNVGSVHFQCMGG